MSLPHFRNADQPGVASPRPIKDTVTCATLQQKKLAGEPISALTAYDYATARLVDEAGIDMLLVGDTLAMVVMGLDSTLPVTVDEMLHHTRAVRRAVKRAFLVADMPFGSYQASSKQALTNAARFLKEAGAEAVKLEGARPLLVEKLTSAEIPVVGHLGLTPQSIHRMGGFKVQGKTLDSIEQLRRDSIALEAAGACVLVLEGLPREVARQITSELSIPTIGIGAGPDCDGQIMVFHDLMNLSFSHKPKFVRQYADAASLFRQAVTLYRRDVETRAFPSEEESYHLARQTREALEETAAETSSDRSRKTPSS